MIKYTLADDTGIVVNLTPGRGDLWQYTMFLDGEELFTGDRYRPSPMLRTEAQIALALLGFLVLQPGDTDEAYFEDYTPTQMAWAKSNRCERASSYVGELDGNY